VDRRDFIATLVAGLGAGALQAAGPATLLVVGDSLSAEYGLRRGTGWVALLEKRLAQHQPTHVAIELGANDALRGLPIAMTEDNLTAMTQASQKAGAQVLLVGIQLPPNYGGEYGAKFAALYEQVARRHKAAVVPFLLKGVADVPDAERLFQRDRIHPTEQAQPTLLENVWPELRKLLADTGGTARRQERKP
jgi:acyl-CoA thioesterase-1